eukprot:628378-Alexandrium_andersonii.AAC.1
MSASLVGSEMCIRDSPSRAPGIDVEAVPGSVGCSCGCRAFDSQITRTCLRRSKLELREGRPFKKTKMHM